MAGLYLHIPFCRKACHYCNFHFSTALQGMPHMVDAIVKELTDERDFLENETIETIYFGGGTPSLLDVQSLQLIFETIFKHYRVSGQLEVTLEANPDDLTRTKLKQLRGTPINRLSIGVQTLHDASLIWMNRTHTASEARNSIEWALNAGFSSLSLDLIYGVPGHTLAMWEQDVAQMMAWRPEHLSCYALTVEEKTVLHHQVKKGTTIAPPDEHVTEQFDLLIDITEQNGYQHYEISNFSLPGKAAKHNSNYWAGVPYLGIGPSAHSYMGNQRRWNVANNIKYIQGIKSDQADRQSEILTQEQMYNEYVMTRLRTDKGCSMTEVEALGTKYTKAFLAAAQKNIASGLLKKGEKNEFLLTKNGKMFADGVILDFFCL
jgi:oxygen-independent coproporphyrinogen III oxidase